MTPSFISSGGKKPSNEELVRLRSALHDEDDWIFGKTFDLLIVYDPKSVVDYLRRWTPKGERHNGYWALEIRSYQYFWLVLPTAIILSAGTLAFGLFRLRHPAGKSMIVRLSPLLSIVLLLLVGSGYWFMNSIQDNQPCNDARGYVLGSYFAWKCGGQREQHLKALLSAKNDYIRVAAATYLCFENEKLGIEQLRRVSKLDGDPGVWAALNLVRRGDKSAMPRALDVFSETEDGGGMDNVPHRNLQKRLLVLLSNSCKASNIPMPEIVYGYPKKEYESQPRVSPEEARKRNLAWWEQVKDKFQIHDPWFAELARRKID